VANKLDFSPNGAVGFIDWLDRWLSKYDDTMLNFPAAASSMRLPQAWVAIGLSNPNIDYSGLMLVTRITGYGRRCLSTNESANLANIVARKTPRV
jgi:hypothetical protein